VTSTTILALITVALAAGTVFFAWWTTILIRTARREDRRDRTIQRLERAHGVIQDECIEWLDSNRPISASWARDMAGRLQFTILGLGPDLPATTELEQLLFRWGAPGVAKPNGLQHANAARHCAAVPECVV
jgi:hypothetical protein